MKGISIAISTIIILAIALIVLLGLVAFFMGSFTEPAKGVSCQAKLQTGCSHFVAAGGCDDNTVTVTEILKEGLNCTLGGTVKEANAYAKAKDLCCIID